MHWDARCVSGSRGAVSKYPATPPGDAIDNADPETRRIAAKYLEAHYLPSTATLSERVAELTRRLLPTGQCSAEAIADQLAMHPRTLQRRLATEGVRCQDLIERERRDQAARYLAEPGLHLSQITGLLGYSEQSALNRSCRRWFGKTPRQYRAELQGQRRFLFVGLSAHWVLYLVLSLFGDEQRWESRLSVQVDDLELAVGVCSTESLLVELADAGLGYLVDEGPSFG